MSDTKLNWIHRHTQGSEIYFVANSGSEAVTAECTFRAPGSRPEYWNPEAGFMSAQTVTEKNGIGETLPLHLDASGSAFIVFRAPDVVSQNLMIPLGETLVSGTLDGPWKVQFPPNWGAPAETLFPSLISWSDSLIPGVRYFSGTAIYSKTFAAAPAWLKAGRRVALDLGKVQIMARVKLNGQDLGIEWKPPFRVEITGALKPGDNQLEISVVNLWPNRMIGDAALPISQRLTWSSWEPFNKETPLLESGLLGPITVRVESDSASANLR